YPQPALQIRGRRRRRSDRDTRRDRLPDRTLPGRERLIAAIKAFLKRHWPRLRLRTILLMTFVFVAALPFFGAVFLRVYENTLVRQTEAELIAQSMVLASNYKSFWVPDGRVPPPVAPPVAERPAIDLSSQEVLGPQPAAVPAGL